MTSSRTPPSQDKPLWVKCRGGCGKKADLAYQVRIAARLGMRGGKPKWQCSECYLSEQKGKQ